MDSWVERAAPGALVSRLLGHSSSAAASPASDDDEDEEAAVEEPPPTPARTRRIVPRPPSRRHQSRRQSPKKSPARRPSRSRSRSRSPGKETAAWWLSPERDARDRGDIPPWEDEEVLAKLPPPKAKRMPRRQGSPNSASKRTNSDLSSSTTTSPRQRPPQPRAKPMPRSTSDQQLEVTCSPKPKPMPKARPKVRPGARGPPPPPPRAARAPPPSSSPQSSASKRIEPRPPSHPPPACLHPSDTEVAAMLVLARHCARLGEASGFKLKQAVKYTVEHHEDYLNCWNWLKYPRCPTFDEHLAHFQEIYNGYRKGNIVDGDRKVVAIVQKHLQSTKYRLPRNLPQLAPVQWKGSDGSPSAPRIFAPKDVFRWPIGELRFSHDQQSEVFTHDEGQDGHNRSILQLAVELLSGEKSPHNIKYFDVCYWEDKYYCRSGNRRLVAYRLAHRFSPTKFAHVEVKATKVDNIFHSGGWVGNHNKRAKLSTQNNGENCEGRFLWIKETQEVAGHGYDPKDIGFNPEHYGVDLLNILPSVARRPKGSAGARRQ